MIGRLKGILAEKQPPRLLLDVNGVGYEVEAPMSTFYSLPKPGEPVTLLTHLAIREDAHVLYGFATAEERELFRSLIRVSGIGPKLALTILSGISVDAFGRCVEAQDTAALTRLPGVGKKTAERLVMEMRDRINADTAAKLPAGAIATTRPADEAQGALIALGYKPQEAARMVREAGGDDLPAEEIIRLALKNSVRA
ncbi:MAG TPA: Holliday junction branch migration protein RuvA [Gammaproteobacteria bacterium]|nr:Holliday junction branch migration protein RuvA [Gammaproteobacteria bacterium]HET7587485.1 Holliday junction branch migration protein RuvA [Gammaproteobacteria bacterium]